MRFLSWLRPLIVVTLAGVQVTACSVQHSVGRTGPQGSEGGDGAPSTTSRSWYFGAETPAATTDAGDTPAPTNGAQAYELDHPDRTWVLPPALDEISDISVLSDTELACVEDDHGIIYVYDLSTARISKAIHFAPKGDYEGLAVAGSTVFVLRSDGQLFELPRLKRHPSVQTHDLRLPASDSEGLCWDAARGRLLIAPKSRDSEAFDKDIRPIFAYDLQQRELSPTPVFQLSLRDVRRFAKHHDLPIPQHFSKDKKRLRSALQFMPSAIAVHPKSGHIFLLSSADHLLISCDETGAITGYALLDANLFRRPEGLAFLSNGDLLISNEAAGEKATVLLFRCRGLGC